MEQCLRFGMPDFIRSQLNNEQADIFAQIAAINEVSYICTSIGLSEHRDQKVIAGLSIAFENAALVESSLSGLYDITKEFVERHSMDSDPSYILKIHEVLGILIHSEDPQSVLAGVKHLIDLPCNLEHPTKGRELLRYVLSERMDDILGLFREHLSGDDALESLDMLREKIEKSLHTAATASGTA